VSQEQGIAVWIIGALGDVATTCMVGATAIGKGLVPPTGLVTEMDELAGHFEPLSRLVFGGHDVRAGSPYESALGIEKELRSFGSELLESARDELEAVAGRIRPGFLFGASNELRALAERELRGREESVSDALTRVRGDIRAFWESSGCDQLVVVHLTSTEPKAPWNPALESLAAFEAAVAADDRQLPASVLYAAAAFEEGGHFVNFTPSLGSSVPAMQELAEARGCCHAGRDGKTGETLVRTILAPMFLWRNLQVLSWSGFNVLGNRDGKVLSDPKANEAKTSGKDAVLRSILGHHIDDSLTRIDYVPSLKDFKTAWDLIHFEGFLGTKMSLQFTWQGADSALAAPLILDLVRLLGASGRAGKRGLLPALACYFKNPMGTTENSFPVQMASFQSFASELMSVPSAQN